jgi:hypothetical protein
VAASYLDQRCADEKNTPRCHAALLFVAPQKDQVWTANIEQIRHAARMIPGTAPLRVNV